MQGDFRLGDRTVVPSMNRIVTNGSAVRVEPKAMRVLLHLAALRGEVAPREEIIRAVWPDTFVTDDVLKRCVSDLRKALGDDRDAPRFIETIPKVGYRLLLVAELVALDGAAPSAPPGEGIRSRTARWRRAALLVAGAIAAPAGPGDRRQAPLAVPPP